MKAIAMLTPANDHHAASPARIHHIVHPTDLSPEGDPAFAHALKLALAVKGHLSLVHSAGVTAAGASWAAFPRVRKRLAQWGLLAEDAPETSVADELGLRVTKADVSDTGHVATMAAYIDRHEGDLVVLATHARLGLDRLTHRSVAEPLVRSASIPALFLPAGVPGFVDALDGAVRLRNILVPIHTSPDSSRAVDLLGHLMRLLGVTDAKIHLLHVGPGHPMVPAMPAGADVDLHRADGPVVDAVCKTGSDVNADLIVMATQGHDGLLDDLRGSTTEQVLRKAGRALLAV